MKTWDKGNPLKKEIEKFTVGNDFLLDKRLVKYDCMASIAHARCLRKLGILDDGELNQLKEGLKSIMHADSEGAFEIEIEDEDCHTAIENFLTQRYGKAGNQIHAARSRNDQVLTALRLYEKDEMATVSSLALRLIKSLDSCIKKHGKARMPGYTHMQKAMQTDVKTWLGSYRDSMNDNIMLVNAVISLIDQSPLGSAAGFGTGELDIDRKMSCRELGFAKVMENPMYCQLSRGKFEAQVLNALSAIMHDLNRLASDIMLFSMKELGYIELPPEFSTGSSMMPHKKNPDVLELLRAKYHVVLGEEFKIKSLASNLVSGYNRDMQLTKEPLMAALDIVKESLDVFSYVVSGMKINRKKCRTAITMEMSAPNEAYRLVKQGMAFRDAYREIGKRFR